MGIAEKHLSKEAADQLVRYLDWLIDEIQFSQEWQPAEDTEKDRTQLDMDFDDPIPFGKE
jgi:hypothetical protein